MTELKILSLHVKEDYLDLSNVVLEVSWCLSKKLPYQGPEGEDMFINMGNISVLDDPDPSTYNEFDNLTEELVKSWVTKTPEYLSTLYEVEKEYRLKTLVNVVVKDPPWNN